MGGKFRHGLLEKSLKLLGGQLRELIRVEKSGQGALDP